MKLVVKTQVTEAEVKEYTYVFDQPVVTIGRLKENDIQLPLSTVSGFHAQILQEQGNHYLVDRGSINGTFLNGQRLLAGEKKLLTDGDIIRIQSFDIYFSSGLGMQIEAGATVQVARQMVMEVLGSWESQTKEKPRLIIMGGPYNGKQVELTEGKNIIIGRGADCDIVVDHPSVSRKHAEVSYSWSGAFIKDLDSPNGVYCNDVRITGTLKLHDRDEIRPGQQTSSNPIRLVFSNPAEALLSKIEEAQITDGSDAIQAKVITSPPRPSPEQGERQGEQAAPAGASAEALHETALETPVAVAPASVAPPQKRLTLPLILIAVALFLILGIGATVLFLVTGRGATFYQADPSKGGPGDVISIAGKNLDSANISSAYILEKNAPVVAIEKTRIQVRVPAFPNVDPTQRETEIVFEGEKGVAGRVAFTLMIRPEIESIIPDSGRAGTEVRVRVNAGRRAPAIYFGSQQAAVKSWGGSEAVAVVPEPAGPIPESGLPVTVSIEVDQIPGKNRIPFTLLSKPAVVTAVPEAFEIEFTAKPYSTTLGFNEYAVETNIGPLLVLVAKDQYGSSQERAGAVARNLNDVIELFSKDPNAKVTTAKEDEHFALLAKDEQEGATKLLLRVYPEDALAYSKINQRAVTVQDLADWWKMLIGSYYKVFLQFQSPAETGILSSGGAILDQIYSFYSLRDEKGEKYYKKDFLNTLPVDQKSRLLSLSLSPPVRLANAEGRWTGVMSNNLYSNISEPSLELNLTLRQSAEGSISGTAEMNWKVVMGGESGFQNVAYRKLGTYSLSGSYRKDKSFPLEFSFVEKESRQLNFVGKLEGGQLRGSFVVSPTGEEGTWSAKPKQ